MWKGTDDTPLGRRKQKVPQKTDETGNVAAILWNRPTVHQLLASSGLILIALCTVLASGIDYWRELQNSMNIAEQMMLQLMRGWAGWWNDDSWILSLLLGNPGFVPEDFFRRFLFCTAILCTVLNSLLMWWLWYNYTVNSRSRFVGIFKLLLTVELLQKRGCALVCFQWKLLQLE